MMSSRLLMLLLVLWGSTAGLLGQSIEKTLVRSFNLQGASDVTLQLQGPVEVKTWSQDILRVQMTVRLDRGSEAMLRSLVQAGRYNLHGVPAEDAFTIEAPGLSRDVLFNGQQLAENISFTVFAPEEVQITVEDGASAAAYLPPGL
jgi:hypothetical protein